MRFEMRRIPCLVFWNTMRGRVLGLFAWLFGTVLVCWCIKGRAAWCAAINPGILHLTYSAALSLKPKKEGTVLVWKLHSYHPLK